MEASTEQEQEEQQITLLDAAVRAMMMQGFEDPAATTLEPRAVKLSAEVMRMFVCEAVHRAGDLAQREQRGGAAAPGGEDDDEGMGMGEPVHVEAEHFAKILPQLLLDFS